VENGVSPAKVIKGGQDNVPPEARPARMEGTVLVDVVVLSDGADRDDVAMDTKFGLAEQAEKASKQ
jgi:hypothetical protein